MHPPSHVANRKPAAVLDVRLRGAFCEDPVPPIYDPLSVFSVQVTQPRATQASGGAKSPRSGDRERAASIGKKRLPIRAEIRKRLRPQGRPSWNLGEWLRRVEAIRYAA